MKFSLLALALFVSVSQANASSPLLTYSWGNQIWNSSFQLFSDGSIEHTEWKNFSVETIQEKSLSKDEMAEIEALVKDAASGTITESAARADLGSESGTIDIAINGEMKPIDGVLRNSIEHAKQLTNSSSAVDGLRQFLKKYVLHIQNAE